MIKHFAQQYFVMLRSVLLAKETRVTMKKTHTFRKPLTNFYHLTRTREEVTKRPRQHKCIDSFFIYWSLKVK